MDEAQDVLQQPERDGEVSPAAFWEIIVPAELISPLLQLLQRLVRPVAPVCNLEEKSGSFTAPGFVSPPRRSSPTFPMKLDEPSS